METKRYTELMENEGAGLTQQEMREGWHFCTDWDFLLTKFDGPVCQNQCVKWTEEQIARARVVP